MAKTMFGVDLGRIMADKVLGDSPEIDFSVIDLAQGVGISGPFGRIDVREGHVFLYTKVTGKRILIEILERLTDEILNQPPKGPGLPRPKPRSLPRP